MAKILCGWEFGSGMGHLTRLLPVARALQQAGHEIVIAVPGIAQAMPLIPKYFPEGIDHISVRLVDGVVWRAPNDPDLRKKPTHAIGDVLALFQYGVAERLGPKVQEWRNIVDHHRPDLIVGDFAPTLRLVSAGKIPFVMLGNGYTVPPAGRLLPPMKPWMDSITPYSRMNEAAIWQVANRARQAVQGPALDYVADMLNGDRSFVCTIPEFDPYQAWRTDPTLMPFNVPVIHDFPPVADRGDQAPIFVYLPSNHPFLKIVLAVLSKIGWPVHVYISGIDQENLASKIVPMAGPNISFHRQPVNLEENLPKFRAIIHHAGLATAYAAVKAGTPQLVLPLNLEHNITGKGLEKFGGTIMITAGGEIPSADQIAINIKDAICQLIEPGPLWDQALQAAQKVSTRPREDGVAQIVDYCKTVLSA